MSGFHSLCVRVVSCAVVLLPLPGTTRHFVTTRIQADNKCRPMDGSSMTRLMLSRHVNFKFAASGLSVSLVLVCVVQLSTTDLNTETGQCKPFGLWPGRRSTMQALRGWPSCLDNPSLSVTYVPVFTGICQVLYVYKYTYLIFFFLHTSISIKVEMITHCCSGLICFHSWGTQRWFSIRMLYMMYVSGYVLWSTM